MTAIDLHDVNQIALDRHAVIEASAGTGKTYTLEHLVMRLLIEKRLRLDQILVVTFTEKATGELLERIRQKLQSEVDHRASGDHDPEITAHLREALSAFDTAAITTIHGFCQRVLRQYAFENSEIFQHDLVSDTEIYQEALHELMSAEWPGRFGKALPIMLELEGVTKRDWEKTILRVLGAYRPEGGDRLLPEQDYTLPVEEAPAILEDHLPHLSTLAGKIVPHHLQSSDLYSLTAGYVRKHVRTDIILPFLQLINQWRQKDAAGDCDLAHVAAFVMACHGWEHWDERSGFADLTQHFYKRLPKDASRIIHTITELAERLEALRQALHLQHISTALTADAIRELPQRAAKLKAERGGISYDDMLGRVEHALRHSPPLLDALRQQYRVALIDEFQDTDPIQWSIFSRLFLGSDEHRLVIIGDPKQAIYGFRGADVVTYLQASDILQREHDAQLYLLPTNYRATPALIAGCNALFATDSWFGDSSDIPFTPVEPPAQPMSAWLDPPQHPACTVRLVPGTTKSERSRSWVRYLRREIVSLLANPPRLRRKDDQRRLRPGDICILVVKKNEADPIIAELTQAGIPTSFYKQTGLYQSEEARHLLYLLLALARPTDSGAVRRALLTRFFVVDPLDLAASDDPLALPAIRTLFDRWISDAQQQNWAELFHSLLYDSGLLVRASDGPEADRAITNYRQLTQDLELIARQEMLDIVDLANHLHHLREQTITVNFEEGLHQQETEASKVTLMTIHASKGLEFPVVFLGGGFGGTAKDTLYTFHDEDGHRVFDLDKCADHKAAHRAEAEATTKRLFYVACTRASHRLYLPLCTESGSACPALNLITPAIQAAQLPTEADATIESPAEKPVSPPAAASSDPPPDLQAWPQLHQTFKHRARQVASFTSLHHRETAYSQSFDTSTHWKEDEQASWQLPDRPDDELPAGANVGSMFHDVLEHIDYSTVATVASPADLLTAGTPSAELIDGKLGDYYVLDGLDPELARRCRLRVAHIVHQTLTTPLSPDGPRLADLPAEDRLHELEFYYPAPLRPDESLPLDIELRDGYLHGYIDLVFRYQGRTCILDWKSNFIDTGYTLDSMEQAMTEANYHLQYRLYTIALDRWLRPRQPDYQFGGVYYLFLRGMNGQDATTGVYHVPTADS